VKEYSFLYSKVFLVEEMEVNRMSIKRNWMLIGNQIHRFEVWDILTLYRIILMLFYHAMVGKI